MEDRIKNFIYNKDANSLFSMGVRYEDNYEYSSAISFYLECADSDTTNALKYEALLRAAQCYIKLGDRTDTVLKLLLHAIAVYPTASEAHFILSQVYEGIRDWARSYTHAVISKSNNTFICHKTVSGLKSMAIDFQIGVAAWWIGKTEESRKIIYDVYLNTNDPALRQLSFTNLRNIGYPANAFSYKSNAAYRLIDKFPGYGLIHKNYSQAAQDMFVITALNGTTKGFYLEIGSADPIRYNNTYILESIFEWTGISIDNQYKEVSKFNTVRKNLATLADALTFDYSTVGNVDYLQVDCEPANTSLEILKRVISQGVKAKVITFEHDRYKEGDSVAQESRSLLSKEGYILKVKDVKFDNSNDSQFEDWWIHPSLNAFVPRFETNILGIDYILKK